MSRYLEVKGVRKAGFTGIRYNTWLVYVSLGFWMVFHRDVSTFNDLNFLTFDSFYIF